MLNIKPVLHVDNEGRLVPIEKVSGRKKSIKRLFEMIERIRSTPPSGQVVFIGHCDDIEGAAHLEKLVREGFKVEAVRVGYIGPVVGAHSGPGNDRTLSFRHS